MADSSILCRDLWNSLDKQAPEQHFKIEAPRFLKQWSWRTASCQHMLEWEEWTCLKSYQCSLLLWDCKPSLQRQDIWFLYCISYCVGNHCFLPCRSLKSYGGRSGPFWKVNCCGKLNICDGLHMWWFTYVMHHNKIYRVSLTSSDYDWCHFCEFLGSSCTCVVETGCTWRDGIYIWWKGGCEGLSLIYQIQ